MAEQEIDKKYKSIEDFRAEDASSLGEQSPLLQFLANTFKRAWKIHKEEVLPEIHYNLEKYGGNLIEDYFGDGEDTEDGNKHIFGGAMIAEKTRRIVSFLVKENPKPEIDPMFSDGYEYKVQEMWRELPDWVKMGVAQHGGAQMNPETQQIEFTNPAGFKEWYNNLVDGVFRYWWRSGNMSTFRYLMAKHAVLCPESYGMLRLVDDDTRIVAEHIKSQNVIKDPTATTVEGRRVFFHVKPMTICDMAYDYNVDRKAFVPDSDHSEEFESIKNLDEDSSLRNEIERVLVVQAFMKDTRTIKVGQGEDVTEFKAYPNGRIITFVANQDTKSGIIVIRDEANGFIDFPALHLILDPEDELHGRALIRDIIRISNLSDEVMQQGIANLRAVGNAFLFHLPDALSEPENFSNEIAQKVEVSDIGAVEMKYPPQGITAEAQGLHNYLEAVARQITGVEEVTEGKTSSNVTSGRQMQLLNSAVSQLMQIIVNHYAEFLTRLGRLWGSMAPYVYKEGTKILYGGSDGKREWHELPFDLDAFVDGFEIYISPETIIPKDEVTKKNMALQLSDKLASDGGPLIPNEYLLEYLDIDNAEEIKAAIEKRNLLMQQLQQMDQQLQQAQQQNQQISGEAQKLQKQNEQLTKKLITQEVSGQFNLVEQQMKDQGMNLREQMKGEFAALSQQIKGAYDLAKARAQAKDSENKEVKKITGDNS